MSTDLERVSLNTTVNSTGSGGRALSTNVRKLHNALNLLLDDYEREQFIHCLNVYHAKRNVFDLVQTLKVILNSPNKRQLLPMLRLVIPRSDQLLFDQYTSEGLYLKTDLLANSGNSESFGETGNANHVPNPTTTHFMNPHELSLSCHASSAACPDGFSTTADGTAPLAAPPGCAFMEEILGEMRQVTLRRSKSHEGLGFSIRGGSEHGVGIYVSLVEPGSFAEKEGLMVGDQIVTVNDMVFDRVTHVEAVKVLKGCKKLAMSVCSVGRIPGGYQTNHVYSWVDPQGRSVSPPPDLQEVHRPPGALRPGHSQEAAEKMVNLNLDDGRSLGLMIRGGAEYGLGIYITGVDPGSAADAGTLKVGDQILEVNGRSFVTIAHDEAVHILKSCRHLLVRVKDVGRLPHARTAVDETKWISSPTIAETTASTNATSTTSTINTTRPSSARATAALGRSVGCRGVGPPGIQVSLEEQAFLLLTDPERQTMGYYLQEYQEGHIGLESLAMALFELFNTHAKLSLLSEVRGLVDPQDLELFDGLVLRREREALTAWHGGIGPPHRCIHQPSGSHQNECSHGNNIQQDPQDSLNALRDIALDEVSSESPPSFKPPPPPSLTRHPRERDPCKRPVSRMSHSGLVFTAPTRLHQECHHKSLKSLSSTSSHYTTPNPSHHTIHNPGHHNTPNQPHHTTPNLGHHTTPNLGHHTTPNPSHHNTPNLGHHNTPNLGHHNTPNLGHHNTLNQSQHTTPNPGHHMSPNPAHHTTPNPGHHMSPNPAHHTTPKPGHHTSLNTGHHTSLTTGLHSSINSLHTSLSSLHHTCQKSLHLSSPIPNHLHHVRPNSGRHTCGRGFLQNTASLSAIPNKETSVKPTPRSCSYEQPATSPRSASPCPSPRPSPLPSPRPSPHPSPCPSPSPSPSPCPSLSLPAAPPSSPDRSCSPSPSQHCVMADVHRLSAEAGAQPQQRGTTLSQLSDSGQTLSEDSGVDIAEAGGVSKDGSPRPSKNQAPQESHRAQTPAAQSSRQPGSPVPTATLVRVVKNANTLGIAIEGGANTRQPLPRIVTIQKGGSAHNCGQLRVGQVILEVNGVSLRGREHRDAARIIAEAFKTKERDHIDFLVADFNGDLVQGL